MSWSIHTRSIGAVHMHWRRRHQSRKLELQVHRNTLERTWLLTTLVLEGSQVLFCKIRGSPLVHLAGLVGVEGGTEGGHDGRE